MEDTNKENRSYVSVIASGLPRPTETEEYQRSIEKSPGMMEVVHLASTSLNKASSEDTGEETDDDPEHQLLMKLGKTLNKLESFAKKHRNMYLEVGEGIESSILTLQDIFRASDNERTRREALRERLRKKNTSVSSLLERTPKPKRKRDNRGTPSPDENVGIATGIKKKSRDSRWQRLEQTAKTIKMNRDENAGKRDQSQVSRQSNQRRRLASTTKRRSTRSEAVLIAPVTNLKYSEILKRIEEKVNPQNHGVEIKAIRKTRKGDILVEVNASSQEKKAFEEAVQKVVGTEGMVKDLSPKALVEIRDMDEATGEHEIREAILKVAQTEEGAEISEEMKIKIFKKHFRGMLKAEVELSERMAIQLEYMAKVKIGWVYYRVRQTKRVTRCYRCHGFGHIALICGGPDRKRNCWKCGALEHIVADCLNGP